MLSHHNSHVDTSDLKKCGLRSLFELFFPGGKLHYTEAILLEMIEILTKNSKNYISWVRE
jgi:hypothetical protein